MTVVYTRTRAPEARGSLSGSGRASQPGAARGWSRAAGELSEMRSAAVTSAMGPFDQLRQQFERRRRAHNENMRRAVAEIDVEVFSKDKPSGATGATPGFQLDGALPPTTPARETLDVTSLAAIGHSEREAAIQLIEQQREASEAETKQRAQATREARGARPKTTPSPSVRGVVGGSTPAPRSALAAARPASAGGGVVDFLPLHEADDEGGQRKQNHEKAKDSPGNWQDWERGLADFHRRAEIDTDDQKAISAGVEQVVDAERRRKYVRRQDFEKRHVAAEAHITKEANRRKKQRAFLDYKEEMHQRMNKNIAEEQARKESCIDEVRACHSRAAARKEVANASRAFSGRRFLVESTCQKVDRDIFREKMKANARASVIVTKQKWDVRTKQFQSRHALCDAEKEAKLRSDRQFATYLLGKVKEGRLREVQSRHAHILANRSFKALLKQMAQELLHQDPSTATDPAAAAASMDLETYRRTLAGLDELARGVRDHGVNVRAAVEVTGKAPEVPLMLQDEALRKVLEPVEGRVHSAFTASTYAPGDGVDAFVHEEMWSPTFSTGSPFENAVAEEEAEHQSAARGLNADGGSGGMNAAPRVHTAPAALTRAGDLWQEREQGHASATPQTAFEAAVSANPPGSSAGLHITSGEPPLAVCPTDVVRLPLSAASISRPTTPRTRREAQSLAALRRIRRTGPLVTER